MEKPSINELIKKAKATNNSKAIQKVVSISSKTTDEIQFSFYIEKELLKKLKLKAINSNTSIKQLINEAISISLK